MDFVVFDFETTGLILPDQANQEDQPYIIEIGARKVSVNGRSPEKIGESFEVLVAPPVTVTDAITKITGIEDEMLRRRGVRIERAIKDFEAFCISADYMIAHNANFDKTVLQTELDRLGSPNVFPPVLCSMHEMQTLVGGLWSLDKLFKHYFPGETFTAHRALSDVDALVAILVRSDFLKTIASA